MPTANDRIRTLAELAIKMTNRDVAAAARLLTEWSGLSVEFAIIALDELVMLEEPAERDDPIDEDVPL